MPSLRVHHGSLVVSRWPPQLELPFGLVPRGDGYEGPARLRSHVRRWLEQHGRAYRDDTLVATEPLPHASPRVASAHDPAFVALRLAGHRGVLLATPEAARAPLVLAVCQALGSRALVLVPDSGAAHRWSGEAWFDVRTVRAVVSSVAWLGSRHEVVVVVAPEHVPMSQLDAVLDGCAALARLGFVDAAPRDLWQRLSRTVGPLVHVGGRTAGADLHELRVPMPDGMREPYEIAWSTFLGAYERFASARPGAGFGTFVAAARRDEHERPALRAWHEAVRLAAWHEHKAAAVSDLLRRHREERIVVFTPSRTAAYELAARHLVPAVTAELPRRERTALLDGFASSRVRTLVGPRLCDLGVTQASADVAILAGGGFGFAQRQARLARVRPGGVAYELVSLDTLEVGRAHRHREFAAAAGPVVLGR